MTDTQDDTFIYFAYGSNMLSRRLQHKTRAPSACFWRTGYVEGYCLTFDKVSTDSKGNRSGKCHIQQTGSPSDRVYGVLFEIKRTEEAALDKAEGFEKGYDKDRHVRVVTSDSTVEALGYLATQRDSTLRPYDWYKAFVIAGAVEHGLPNDYLDRLRTVASAPDPDDNRRVKNEAILSGS